MQANLALHSPLNKSKAINGMKKINPLPDDKILDLPKLKAFADDKSNVTQTIKVCFIE